MDSPNVKMRRHQSLPTASRGNSILMRISKSNPYVGTFRHSPPTSIHAEYKQASSSSSSSLQQKHVMWMDLYKNSPYIGTKRHAPSSCRLVPSSLLEVELYRLLVERTLLPTKLHGGLHKLKDLLCGHLLGGGTNERIIDWQLGLVDAKLSSHHHHSSSASGTIQVLTRLACWLLLPFQDAPLRSSSSCGASTSSCPESRLDDGSSFQTQDYEIDENSTHTSGYDDDCSYCPENDVGPGYNNNNIDNSSINNHFGSNSVISSQAEAYYAHQATSKALDQHHLDYTITQMDVLRMMRNASRHLDVESIVRLPVCIYQKENTESKSSRNHPPQHPTAATTQEESWCLVQQGEGDCSSTNTAIGHDDEQQREYCVICLEHFETGDRLRVLPCDHSFHDGCISRWLSGSHSFDDCFTSGCPTCRKCPHDDEIDNVVVSPHHHTAEPEGLVGDGSMVPSWAFSRIGDALARNF